MNAVVMGPRLGPRRRFGNRRVSKPTGASMQESGSLLGTGRVAKVYRRGDTVLKLYDDAGSKAAAP